MPKGLSASFGESSKTILSRPGPQIQLNIDLAQGGNNTTRNLASGQQPDQILSDTKALDTYDRAALWWNQLTAVREQLASMIPPIFN